MGCSNPHPHCQIWASSFLPNEAKVKEENFKKYFDKFGTNMLVKYAESEDKVSQRALRYSDYGDLNL